MQLDKDLAAAHKRTLSLHVCDTALAFATASGPGTDHTYAWAASGLDWSDQAVRTVRLSRDTTAPTVVSATVNATSLVLTFSEALGAAANLANAPFTVNKTPKDGQEEPVPLANTAPVIAGKTVTLTLAAAVVDTDSVTVSYEAPTSGNDNKLLDLSGNPVADFAGRAVTNETVPPKPELQVASLDDTSLVLTFTEALDMTAAGIPTNAAFTVRVTEPAETTATATLAGTPAVAGAVVTLTLAAVPAPGSDVTVSYAKPTGANDGKLRSAGTMTEVESFGPEDVVFNSAPTAADGTVSATEDTDYAFAVADFGYTDPDNDALASVTVESLPADGTGQLKFDGAAIPAEDLPKTVTAAELGDDKLTYTPPENANGAALASFTFKVNDGTVSSTAAYTLAIDVAAANDAATGAPAIAVANAFRVPAVLSVDLSGIADADGVTNIAGSITYDWQRFDATGTTLEADGIGTGATYTLAAADVGKKLKVAVSFDDDDGNVEGPLASAAVPADANTVAAAADCVAPTLTGGAGFVGAGRTLTLGKESVGGADWHGFSADAGALDAEGFTIGTDEYTIGAPPGERCGRAERAARQGPRRGAQAYAEPACVRYRPRLRDGERAGHGPYLRVGCERARLVGPGGAHGAAQPGRDGAGGECGIGRRHVAGPHLQRGAGCGGEPCERPVHGEQDAEGRHGGAGSARQHRARHRGQDGDAHARRRGHRHRQRDGELRGADLGQRQQTARPLRQPGRGLRGPGGDQ